MISPFDRLRKMQQEIEIKPEGNAVLVQNYEFFKDKFPITDNAVLYYPCCGADISPSQAFAEQNIVYVDTDRQIIEILKQSGYKAICEDATKLNLDKKADLMFLINTSLPPENLPLNQLSDGGFILCNAYHGAAKSLYKNNDFVLLGVINNQKGAVSFDDKDLSDYFEQIETDEELRQHAKEYEYMKKIVEQITDKQENILETYKNIIKTEIAKNPDNANMLFISTNHHGEKIILDTRIPTKKSTASNNTFVFQHKKPK